MPTTGGLLSAVPPVLPRPGLHKTLAVLTHVQLEFLSSSQIMHTLQKERDMSTLYISSTELETKDHLVSSYRKTDMVRSDTRIEAAQSDGFEFLSFAEINILG